MRRDVKAHLRWRNRKPTPFISVYADWDTAWKEAKRRKKDGKKSRVTLTSIDVSQVRGELEYRNMRRLCSSLRIWIPGNAWNNSEHEWIFLNHIPEHVIVSVKNV